MSANASARGWLANVVRKNPSIATIGHVLLLVLLLVIVLLPFVLSVHLLDGAQVST